MNKVTIPIKGGCLYVAIEALYQAGISCEIIERHPPPSLLIVSQADAATAKQTLRYYRHLSWLERMRANAGAWLIKQKIGWLR